MARYKTEDGALLDTNKAIQSWDEETDWNGNNHISRATGSQWEHERLHKSAKGRYWKESWSQWSGTLPSAELVSNKEAAAWLIHNDEALPEDLASLADFVAE